MNNIWDILQIEPTRDKRTIKWAYAARAKLVHPEEKPEEFAELYQAYQLALKYAGNQSAQAEPPAREPSQNLQQPELSYSGDYGLHSFFSDSLKRQEQDLELFSLRWDMFSRRLGIGEADKEWVEYLKSEEFKRIQWNPIVVEQIAQEVKRKLCYWSKDQLVLWDAYGFQEEGPPQEIPEVRFLYETLYPAYQSHKQTEFNLEREKRQQEEKEQVLEHRKTLIRAAIICLCILIPFLIYRKATSESQYLNNYMTQKYPDTLFEKIEKKKLTDSVSAYYFSAREHPDIRITARVRKKDSSFEVNEDYGEQLVEHYARQYGFELTCEYRETSYRGYRSEKARYVIYYPDIENLGGFCRGLLEMLDKEEKLAFLNQMAICPQGILYPDWVIEGGHSQLPEEQYYIVDEITDSWQLEQRLREAYIDYMYNYEAWNLTPEQRAAWDADYVARGRIREAGQTVPDDLLFLEEQYGIYIPFYSKSIDNYAEIGSYQTYSYKTATYTTVGNAYQLLKTAGADITIREDRSGFIVNVEGTPYAFGDEEEVSMRHVLDLI